MEKLTFSTNWNSKLECNCFTTIRLYNIAKHFQGNQFEIFLQKKFKSKALVLGTVITKLDKLSDYVCYLDTGYNKEQTKEILGKCTRTLILTSKKFASFCYRELNHLNQFNMNYLIKNKQKY